MKIDVELGATICVDPDNRQYIRMGAFVKDIDTEHDIEAQANEALAASITVMRILDDGLKESVTEVIMGAEKPGLVRDELGDHEDKINRLARSWQQGLGRMDEMEKKIDALRNGDVVEILGESL